MFDMARLAFETDSARLVMLLLNSVATTTVSIDAEPLKGYPLRERIHLIPISDLPRQP